MLDVGGAFPLQIPDESEQGMLRSAKAVGLEGDTYTTELQKQDLDIAEGRDVFVFPEAGHDFLQKATRILKILRNEPTLIIEFRTTGAAAKDGAAAGAGGVRIGSNCSRAARCRTTFTCAWAPHRDSASGTRWGATRSRFASTSANRSRWIPAEAI